MPSSDRKSERAPAARFLDVTEGKLRAPSWVASQRAGFRRASDPAFKAPRVPSDLVAQLAPVVEAGAHPQNAPDGGRSRSRPPAARTLEAPLPGAATGEAERELATVSPSVHPPSREPDPALVEAFVAAIDALSRARTMVLDDSLHEVTELSITIARRVIARELSIDPTIVEGLVREGLAALGREDRITVRLGSQFARAAAVIERRLTVGDQRVEIILDPGLHPHGCIVETDLGRVDESIESRLSALISALESDSEPPVA